MELLLLLVLGPSTILSQKYISSSSSNSNDEPFLPIYPIYPYNPKLIKRGTERDLVAHLTPELYAPKLDARDSYTASFNNNYQRDPYYPSYNPYPKTPGSNDFPVSSVVPNTAYTSTRTYPTTTSFASLNAYTSPNVAGYTTPNTYTPYNGGYSTPYSYPTTPYGMYNSYSTPYTSPPNPYSPSPYVAGSYPNYNYQTPYYYPNYYNQPYPPHPPPPPPHPGQEYPGSSNPDDSSDEDEPTTKSNTGSKKSESKKNRYKENDNDNNKDAKDEQFIDGVNFLASGTKDLDGQSTTYKTPNSYNQLEQLSDVRLRSVPIPGLQRTTYRVISVGGQPVGPDYPLPSSYTKVQQLEQIMSQTLAKLLAQNAANQARLSQYQTSEESDNSGSYGNEGFINRTPQSVIAKTGLAYVANPNNLPKTANNPGQFVSNYGTRRNPVIIKVQDPSQILQHSSTVLSKAAPKYSDGHYPQKSVTTVSLQQAPGVYIPPEAKDIKDESSQSSEYNDYDTNTGQSYESSNSGYKKNEQNYSIDQGGQSVPYHSSNLVTVQTPQPQNYQYSSYLPTQSAHQQQAADYKTSLEDVNFGTKRNSKV